MSNLASALSVQTPLLAKIHLIPQKNFTKKFRLRKRGQFLYVQHKGVRVQASCCFAYITYHNRPYVRLGITVSKKVGKAHQRNRIKRLMREAFRHSTLRTAQGFDMVVVAKKENPPKNFRHLIDTFDQFYSSAMKYKDTPQTTKANGSRKSTFKSYRNRQKSKNKV